MTNRIQLRRALLDKLTIHIELRNGRPIAVFFDTLADGIVFQNIHSNVISTTRSIEDLHGA